MAVREMTRPPLPVDNSSTGAQPADDRYREAVHRLPYAVFVHSEGAIRIANDACAQLFGLPAKDRIVGRRLSELFSQDTVQALLAQEISPSGPPLSIDTYLQRRDGVSPIPIQLVGTSVVLGGRPVVQVMMSTLTAQRDPAIALQQAKRMEAVATLAGGIAHELNNCLTAILGFSDLALPSLEPESRAHGHIQQVLLASRRARDLITQLLMFGRQTDQATQPFSLDILLKETLRLMRRKWPEHIRLREWIPGAMTPVMADPSLMHQICLTLLEHLRKTSDTMGGPLEVRLDSLHCDNPGSDTAPPLASGQYVRLTMSNAVEGAPASAPPFTGNCLSTERGEIADIETIGKVIQAQGGALRVIGSAREGYTFDLYLPAVNRPPSIVADQ
ncbi:PAS domain-containing protein [Nitrospirales bacterium NOB]|nr:PAS domain-containing protein [Nitrospirales bacterium NOB]